MNNKDIPYIAFEGELARMERIIKRLVISLVFIVALLVVTNLAWLYVFNQYDFSFDTVTLDSGGNGIANYIGSSGVINNGEN